jgi:hypothetical protein
MREFVLLWSDGTNTTVMARNIVHAIMKAGIPHSRSLSDLVSYQTDSRTKQIAGQSSSCGCDRHSGSCHHDLVLAKLLL